MLSLWVRHYKACFDSKILSRPFCTKATAVAKPSRLKEYHKILTKLSNVHKITCMSDWYKDLLIKNAKHSPKSLYELLYAVYPEHNWLPWKFDKCPSFYWDNEQNRIKYMKWLSIQLNINDMEDWYKVTYRGIAKLGGLGLLHKFNNSPLLLLANTYPEKEWLPWKFSQVPPNYWEDSNNRIKYMNWLASQLKIENMESWCSVSRKDWSKYGRGILDKYDSSPFNLLSAVYPEYEWLPWKFLTTPRNFWEDMKNQRKFMDWMATQLSIKDMEEWYSILVMEEIKKNGGRGLVNIYNESPLLLLSSIYPEYEWLPWKFKHYPRNWSDVCYQRQFLNRVSKQLNVNSVSDWYKISSQQLIDQKGGFLLFQNGSLYSMLSTVYSDSAWYAPKFKDKVNIWSDKNLAKYFIEWLAASPETIGFMLTSLNYADKNKVGELAQLITQRFGKRKKKG